MESHIRKYKKLIFINISKNKQGSEPTDKYVSIQQEC
jgi:hypothetical protein